MNLSKDADNSIFLKKRKQCLFTKCLKFALTYRKVTTFIKILKLLANGNIKKHP